MFKILIFLLLASCKGDLIVQDLVKDDVIVVEGNIFLEGIHYFYNGSHLEFLATANNDLIINEYDQKLTTINPYDNSMSNHPKISLQFKFVGKEFEFFENFNYSFTDNVLNDTTGEVLKGRHLTYVNLKINKDDRLRILIKIYGVGAEKENIICSRVLWEIL